MEQRHVTTYAPHIVRLMLVGGNLALWAAALCQVGWLGTKEIHGMVELAAAFTALSVGIMALIRYYAQASVPLLLIGCGFLAVFFLDLANALIVNPSFNTFFTRGTNALLPWSWFASRIVLGALLLVAMVYLVKHRTVTRVRPIVWYFVTIVLTVFVLSYYTLLPIPRAYYPDFFIFRPWELLPGVLFVGAFVLLMRSDAWKADRFYQWLSVALLVNVGVQFFLMPFSSVLFDAPFIAAKVAKLLSYVFVLTGFLSSITELYEKTKIQADDLRKFKLALDQTSDQVMITDIDGKVLYANQGVARLTGYDLSEVLQHTVWNGELWESPMDRAFYTNLWKTIKKKKQTFTGEVTNKRKDGTEYITALTISPVSSGGDDEQYFIGIERDITEEKQIDKAKTEFVSLASHQLRTPLSSINWYTEMLLDGDAGKINKEQREFLTEVKEGSRRMVDLVNSLLNVSRLELGTFMIEPEATDIVALAESVVDEQRPRITEKGHTFTTKFAKRIPAMNVDTKLLRMVFQNLVSNAVKYTPNNGQLTFEIKKDTKNKRVAITIADNGIGIPTEQQKQIFGKLFRADNAVASETDGNGLGLYIVKSVIEESGGTIRFESEEGKGTSFFITLPEKGMIHRAGSKMLDATPGYETKAKQITKKKKVVAPSPLKGRTILVIEDEPTQRTTLRRRLSKEGAKVLKAKDGAEGLTLALAKHPELIFLDIVMPNMNGLEMEEVLRKDVWGKEVPVIALTNIDDTTKIKQLENRKSFKYLLKSNVALDDIVAAAKDVLG
ncbi:PAS domain S-box protein [Candidatus Kaiserbacteria bacterium]|nr:PAS domain S-box protein [Candidatus Kaiserbacteria bacterium]